MTEAKAKRFYLPSYKLHPGREVLFQDIGNLLTIGGIVLQGMDSTIVLMLPGADLPRWLQKLLSEVEMQNEVRFEWPTLDEWGEIIRQSDNPEQFVGEAGSLSKTLHRKIRYQISGSTSSAAAYFL